MDKSGDFLKFVNMKLKEVFDVQSFFDTEGKLDDLQEAKSQMDHEFDAIYQKVKSNPFGLQDSENFTERILENFKVTIKDDRLEESKEIGGILVKKKPENISLKTFLDSERELCLTSFDSQRSAKISLSYSHPYLKNTQNLLARDYIVKTSMIEISA